MNSAQIDILQKKQQKEALRMILKCNGYTKTTEIPTKNNTFFSLRPMMNCNTTLFFIKG